MQKGVAYDKRCLWRGARALIKTKAGGGNSMQLLTDWDESLCCRLVNTRCKVAAEWRLEKSGDHRVQGSTITVSTFARAVFGFVIFLFLRKWTGHMFRRYRFWIAVDEEEAEWKSNIKFWFCAIGVMIAHFFFKVLGVHTSDVVFRP